MSFITNKQDLINKINLYGCKQPDYCSLLKVQQDIDNKMSEIEKKIPDSFQSDSNYCDYEKLRDRIDVLEVQIRRSNFIKNLTIFEQVSFFAYEFLNGNGKHFDDVLEEWQINCYSHGNDDSSSKDNNPPPQLVLNLSDF